MSNEGKSLRLLLVDDHTIVREGLRAMLSTQPAFAVVGEASSGDEAVEMVNHLNPHVVITDVRMPGMDGIELTRQIKAIRPGTAVIVLTIYESETYLLEALSAGASAYLVKDSPLMLLCHAISTAVDGGTMVRSSLLQQAAQTMLRVHGKYQGDQPDSTPIHRFTARELKLLEMISQGYANKEMASKLNLAEVTVKKHLQGIFTKLEVSDRTQAAIMAVRMGLVE
ncbi:MAG: response regulator transcription factor [Chloroflexota bacterium]